MRVSLPEQVWLDLKPASFGSRSLAFLLDFLLRWGVILFVPLLIFLLLGLVSAFGEFGVAEVWRELRSWTKALPWDVGLAIFSIFVFLVELSYPIFFEVKRQGVTPGKKIMGLRVVDEQGLPITARTSFIRTIFIPIDFSAGGIVAFFSMMLSERSQRLGDLAAKTLVVHELPIENTSLNTAQNSASSEARKVVVSLALYNSLQRFCSRRDELSKEGKEQALLRLAEAIKTQCPNEKLDYVQDEVKDFAALEAEICSLQRRVLPRKEQSAAGVDITLNWESIESELEQTSRALDRLEQQDSLEAGSLFEIVEKYQQVCQRYAYLETFYPDTVEARQAARLIRRGRRLLYGSRLSLLQDAAEPWWQRVPSGYREIRPFISFSTFLMLFSALVAAVLVDLNPSFSWYFVDEATAAQLREGHLWTDSIQGSSSSASARILTNNIGVTFTAFALGITAGVGTLLVLVMNGALLGGMFMSLTQYAMAGRLFNFVTAHGVLELSIIAVAGGMGLFVGDAIINPGTLSRKRALQRRARLLIDFILFNAACLVLAGIVEGFISPYTAIPYFLKAVVGLGLGAMYWAFLIFGYESANATESTD